MIADPIDYDENSYKLAGERELQVFSGVVEGYASSIQQQLIQLQKQTAHGASILNTAQPHHVLPVQLKLSPHEPAGVYHVRCDIDNVNKVVLALTALCTEVKTLTREMDTTLVYPLLLYGDQVKGSEVDGEVQLSLSRVLGVLSCVQSYSVRVTQVAANMLQQLDALHPQNPAHAILNTKDVHLQVVWEQLARLLGSLVLLDEVIACNSVLHQHWGAYKRLVRNAPNMLRKEGDNKSKILDKKTLSPLQRMLDDIEKNVLQGNMFKRTCRVLGSGACRNSAVRDEMAVVMMGWLVQLETQCGDQWWSDVERDVVGVTCLYLLHQHLYEPPHNKRLVKQLQLLYKKVPCVTLIGSLVWHGERYIVSCCPALAGSWDNKSCDVIMQHRQHHLDTTLANLSKQAEVAKAQVAGWSVEMAAAATKPASQFSRLDLSHRTSLFMQGVVLGLSAKYTVCSLLNLHASLGRPLGRACVLSACALLHAVHTVRAVYRVHTAHLLPHALPLVTQFIVAQLIAAVKLAKTRLSEPSSKGGGRGLGRLDSVGCLAVVEHCLGASAATATNTTTARVALSLAANKDLFKDDELPEVVLLLRRLELCASLAERVDWCTDVGPLLYLHRPVLHTYCASVAALRAPPLHMQAVVWAACQSSAALKSACHLPPGCTLVDEYRQHVCHEIQEQVIGPVCSAVETELRLSTSSQMRSPFQEASVTGSRPAPGTTGTTAAPAVLDPTPFFDLPALHCLGNIMHIKSSVELYLSRTFYSLTVVAPHDSHKYQEMRALAYHKWGLRTHDSGLPAHTTQQGVDVLEVVRQLGVFVRSYHYSLSQQVFVEANSHSKHLNTLTIEHIASSIRTHGTGIVNSTVNLSYQFLVSKFKLFSQFLFDEQIKSRLVKDRRHWKEVRTAEEKWFPFVRAEKFALGIRKLGLNADGLSYLDQFRGLVTQMGNAMGYVRLVRSGCLRCSSNTVRFLPNLTPLHSFAHLCQQTRPDAAQHHDTDHQQDAPATGSAETLAAHDAQATVSAETLAAARNLDTVLEHLQQTFHKETDYFKILVEVFSSAVSGATSPHLANFYLIVPPLTLSFVHCAVAAKDLLNKKNKVGAAFTMDGFAMGVAYLLSVLGQGPAFESLHWWAGVRRHYALQQDQVEKQRAACLSSGDAKLAETLSLTSARLRQHSQEHELLLLTIDSARGFFRGATDQTREQLNDKTNSDKDSVKSTDKDSVKSGDA